MRLRFPTLLATMFCFGFTSLHICAQSPAPAAVTEWTLQDAAKVPDVGAQVSAKNFKAKGWYRATVPGTVLTTLVDNHVYPEPTYGENERPEIIPESLSHTSYWYRAQSKIPASYAGRHIWLNFDGINYTAEIWVNGIEAGTMRGAFARGRFDVSANVTPGQTATIAVHITPQPHPGVPDEHTLKNGVGKNGGITALDGPTFLSTLGWDWLPAVRDRDTGIWQKVFFSATGPVQLKDPLVTTDLPLPSTDSSDITVQTTVQNLSDDIQEGIVKGSIGDTTFERSVRLAPRSSQEIGFTSADTPVLHWLHPKLWWPNGYGAQNLYKLHLQFEQKRQVSDTSDVTFGVRKITYTVPESDNLTISVNGVRIFIRGGDWGLDEALKRVPVKRLEAQIRMHQIANLNLIRNWVGQSTSEDLYALCDKYGILVWDEFFQPNPNDGPNPDDIPTYIANVRDKILRFRNHPSIALWCARNEGNPPEEIDKELRKLLAEVEPTRLYQPSSTDGGGVKSGGPYRWRVPSEFYKVDAPFKTETGSVSIPTLESIHGMMPQKDWETINDDWAQHDLAKGAAAGNQYPVQLANRYGAVVNLADFVRKAQLANYEAYRAMFEGRNAALFHPATGVITWMSHPAQPSFVWQLYHYDLEPNSSLFAVKEACELVHAQFNEATGNLEVINNLPLAVEGAKLTLSIYNMDGSVAQEREFAINAPEYAATVVGPVEFPGGLSVIHFLKLQLHDKEGKLISDNFYWHAKSESRVNYAEMEKMKRVTVAAEIERKDEEGKAFITVTLHNSSRNIALMIHLQLRRKSGERVLPVFYSANYLSLVPDETRTVQIEASLEDLKRESALVVADGWNISVEPSSGAGVAIAQNIEAQVESWPATGLPFATTGLR